MIAALGFCLLILPLIVLGADPTPDELLAAGVCEEFADVPMACRFLLSGVSVWTAPSFGLTQETWTAAMYTPPANSSQGVLDFLPAMPYECATAYLSLMCPTFFRPCSPFAPAPLSMCQSECIATNEACRLFFQDTPLDCNQRDPLTGQPQWPDASLLTPPQTCLTVADIKSPLEPPVYLCPEPLIWVAPGEDPYTGLPCSTTCHFKLRMLTEDPQTNFDDVFIVFSVLNWVSFVLVIISLVVYMSFPDNRKYPRVINIFIGFGLLIVHLGFIGNSFMSIDDNMCQNDYELESGSSWCRFQSWTSYFGALYVVFYWMLNAVIMFWNIGLLLFKNNKLEKFSYYYHVFVFVYSFTASMIIMWVPDSASTGASPGVPYCFVGPTYIWALSYGLFWWPFYVGTLVIFFCCIGCIITIARTASVDGKWQRIKRRLPSQLTIFLFLVVWLITVASMISLQSSFQSTVDDGVATTTEWYTCVFFSPTPYSECPIRATEYANLVWWELVCVGLIGTWFFVIYIIINPSQRSLYQHAWNNYKEGNSLFGSRQSMRGSTTRVDQNSAAHAAPDLSHPTSSLSR